ncbi:MAG: S46 family peptidase [Bacteroidales bacterium]|nr:S46 family peptidase [Bacteroidales bacterium]
MKFLKLFFVSLFIGLFTLFSKADEGMWIPSLIGKLNYADMQKLGCKLTPEEIYSINHSSIKDAIFQLGHEQNGEFSGFCTAEMVSGKGLLFTNHHCGYDAIAKLSTVEHDYLANGFWAKNMSEELSAEGLCASHLIRIEDVTARVLEGVKDDMKEEERTAAIRKAIAAIEKEAKEGNGYSAKVKQFFAGNEYYLFVYEVFRDVRLVGAPPSSIGKFGGDTDNWMWPRHTGDFSIFRVYMSADGKPATYNKDNVPYAPLYHLNISIKGIKPNDFTMIMGYPGQTERYLTASGMEYKRDVYNPTLVKLVGKKLEVWKKYMDASKEVKIALASDYASLANGYKLWQGEMVTLQKTDAVAQRSMYDQKLQEWINADAERMAMYGNIINDYKESYKAISEPITHLIYFSFGILQGSSQIMAIQPFLSLEPLLKDKKANEKQINETISQLKEHAAEMFKGYYPEIDKEAFKALLLAYLKDIPKDKQLSYFTTDFVKNFKGKTDEERVNNFLNVIYTKSIFTDKTRMDKFLSNPSESALSKDPLLIFQKSVLGEYQFKLIPAYQSANSKFRVLDRKYFKAIRQFEPNKAFYPDANSTFRLTYGTVQPYKPKDAVYYNYITYLDGVIEKMDNTNPEFMVDARLVELYNKKDFGRYADETGKLPVAFLSDNDITGGNSGSPIMNANGELIGIAFDGNWDWLCSNFIYSKELQRTINVDVRYVLWVIEKFAGATNIIDELTIKG